MQNPGRAQAQAWARAQRAQPSIPSFAFGTYQNIARNVGTLIPGAFFSVELPPDRKSAKEPRKRVERVKVLLAAADVKGGLGTGGSHCINGHWSDGGSCGKGRGGTGG